MFSENQKTVLKLLMNLGNSPEVARQKMKLLRQGEQHITVYNSTFAALASECPDRSAFDMIGDYVDGLHDSIRRDVKMVGCSTLADAMQKANSTQPAKVGAQMLQSSHQGVAGTYAYDDKGNLLAEFDALGQMTEYLNSDDGLPHTIIDATYKSKYLWWNTLAQVERYQDCSGKSTYYRYDERQHLVAVTDALNQTTSLERKPEGEVLRISHPDGTTETFTYNVYGQVLSHTDGKGQTTRLMRTARGLPSSRQDAKGQRVRYEYDKAIRLTALVNENNATYSFAYDASDRLSEEVRVDNLTRRFSYNVGGHLTRLDEIGYGENAERPERHTLFERDAIGRLVAKINRDASQTFAYDDGDRLLSIERQPTGIGKQLGITEESKGSIIPTFQPST